MGKLSLAQAYPGILERYLNYAIFYSKACFKILKTDCFNEAEGRPIAGGIAKNIRGEVYCIDINRDYVERAKKIGVNAQHGDIRNIPFDNGSFDCVFDFSTIDHIRDYGRALREYDRVMKPGGLALIVYWAKKEDDFSRGDQYYFCRRVFEHKFRNHFRQRSSSVLFEDGNRQLICLVGMKGEG